MVIHTFGDGFIHPHLFIKWPQIIKSLCHNVTVKNNSAIGAGNEWIANTVLKQELNPDDLYLIQWTTCDRFDFIVNDNLNQIINKDPTYKDNIYENWWCSSASKTEFIFSQRKYISSEQMKIRTLNHVLMIQNLFDNLNLNYRFMSSYQIDWLSNHPAEKLINWKKWLWHQEYKGMDEFAWSKFMRSSKHLQPTPYIQYRWITDILMPNLDLDWQLDKVKSVGENLAAAESKYH